MIPFLKNYEKFILKNKPRIINPSLIKSNKLSKLSKGFIIKHDVECSIEKMEAMANIETKNNISSIWLLQDFLLIDSNKDILNKIKSKGHIIGFHYDVLDNNNGNFNKALIDFENIKKWFDKNIETLEFVCPHGNPLKERVGYNSNKDFWLKYRSRFKSMTDLVMDFDGVSYSDVSYSFFKIQRLGKKKSNEISNKVSFGLIDYNKFAIISIHSHRWSKFYVVAFLYFLRFHLLKSAYNIIKQSSFFKKNIDKFYKTSKYI